MDSRHDVMNVCPTITSKAMSWEQHRQKGLLQRTRWIQLYEGTSFLKPNQHWYVLRVFSHQGLLQLYESTGNISTDFSGSWIICSLALTGISSQCETIFGENWNANDRVGLVSFNRSHCCSKQGCFFSSFYFFFLARKKKYSYDLTWMWRLLLIFYWQCVNKSAAENSIFQATLSSWMF